MSDLKAFIEDQKTGGARDNGRTPMQWNATANAGFTTGMPWLKVNANAASINVEAEEKEPNSILNYFRKMVKLRKDNLLLTYGKYTLLDKDNPNVYAYTRELNGEKLLVLLNFRKEKTVFNLDKIKISGKAWINNYPSEKVENGKVNLEPYQAVIFKAE